MIQNWIMSGNASLSMLVCKYNAFSEYECRPVVRVMPDELMWSTNKSVIMSFYGL